MPLIPLNNENITQSVISDATYLASVIAWAKGRYNAYNLMITEQVLTDAGIAAGDIPYVQALIVDLDRIIKLTSGVMPANTDDMLYHITHLIGLK